MIKFVYQTIQEKMEPKQWELFSLLKKYFGAESAFFYKDACLIMSGHCELSAKVNLVSHLMREILSRAHDVLLSKEQIDSLEPNKEKLARDKVDLIAKQYSLEQNELIIYWKDCLIGKKLDGTPIQGMAHRGPILGVREVNDLFINKLRKFEALLFLLLRVIEIKIPKDYDLLDEYLAKKIITSKDIKNMRDHVTFNHDTLTYFFQKFTHYEMLPAFNKYKFFTYPPDPITVKNGVIFPVWPVLDFLLKAVSVSNQHRLITEICQNIETDNYNVQGQVIEILCALPAKHSKALNDKIIKWLRDKQHHVSSEPYMKLIINYLNAGFISEAKAILNQLLSIKPSSKPSIKFASITLPNDPEILMDDYEYRICLKQLLDLPINKCSFGLVEILIEKLAQYLRIKNENKKDVFRDDDSQYWRERIVEEPQYDASVGNLLVSAIRDFSINYLSKYPIQINELRKILLKKKYLIFVRIWEHVLSTSELDISDKNDINILRAALLNDEEYSTNRMRFTYEYYCLTKRFKDLLTKKDKIKIWQMIQKNPDGIMKYKQYWQAYHLAPFTDFGEKWDLAKLKVNKEIDYENYRRLRITNFEQIELKNIKELEALTPQRFIEYIASADLGLPNIEEQPDEQLSMIMKNKIIDNPEQWLEQTEKIEKLPRLFVRSFFDGLNKAIEKNGVILDWAKVFDFSRKIIIKHSAKNDKPNAIETTRGLDPDWSWCRRSIIVLVETIIKNRYVDTSQSNNLLDLVVLLLDEPNPKDGEEDDLVSMGINSNKGAAIHCLFEYLSWMKQVAAESKENFKISSFQQIENYLKLLFTTKSAPIVAIMGWQLGRLMHIDEKWMTQYLNVVIDVNDQSKFDAAWDGFICLNRPHLAYLKSLENQYIKAIGEIKHKNKRQQCVAFNSKSTGLTQHIICYLLWNKKQFPNSEIDIYEYFYDHANEEMRKEAIRFIGHILNNDKFNNEGMLKQMVALMDRRISLHLNEQTRLGNEFENYSFWFASKLFSTKWRYETLIKIFSLGYETYDLRSIIETLDKNAAKIPVKTARVCKVMSKLYSEGWEMEYHGNELIKVMNKVIQTNEIKAIKLLEEATNTLISNGRTKFREINNECRLKTKHLPT